jgi:hypothetical protein
MRADRGNASQYVMFLFFSECFNEEGADIFFGQVVTGDNSSRLFMCEQLGLVVSWLRGVK